jgi:SAM-dependent methyltransferase
MGNTPAFAATQLAEFDSFASWYNEALHRGLSVTGESADYFARGRIAWLAHRLAGLRLEPRNVLDFGCGTGTAAPYLLRLPGCTRVHGVDVSEASLEVAWERHGSAKVTFSTPEATLAPDSFDLAFCSGVFHHIPVAERKLAMATVWRSMRPGGVFAFWENNPWNPGTRYVMSRIPFDRNAITLSPPEARRLLRSSGFEVLRTDFLFVFPAFLRALRWLEHRLTSLPIGGQYLVLARKPVARYAASNNSGDR